MTEGEITVSTFKPESVTLDLKTYMMQPFKRRNQVKLSDLKEYFSDPEAADQILLGGKNPIIYEYYEYTMPEAEGHLTFGVTTVYSGKVGKEYYMTRGHYHEKDDAEVYIGFSGSGLLLMQTKEGETMHLDLKPGSIGYVPPRWGHRTINTSSEKLVFFFIYPSDAGHDYELVKKKGFAKIVIEEDSAPKVVDNPRS